MRRIMSSVVLLLVLLGGAAVATQDAHDHHHHHHHDCIHDRIKDLPGRGINAPRINVSYDFDTASTDPAVRRVFKSKASTYASIRVSFFWDSGDCTTSGSTSCGHCTAAGNSVTDFSGNTVTCGTDDVLTDAKKTYILTYLMPAAATFYAQALSVVPVSGNLILSGSPSTCGSSPGTPIPSAHTSTGIANTDLAIYVTAVPVKGGGSTAAWASACRYDSAGRPVAAQVNFVPSQLSNAGTLNTVQLDTDQHIAIHELGHALGFASPWFDSKKGYLNLDGVTYTVSTGLTTVTSSTLGKSVTYLSSPRVAREVQNYFGCTSIPGGEIEDQGGSGTQGSHWEKRVFQQDTMSGIASTTELFHSRFTLAMLEDTGHYVANYNVADPRYSWGASKGCTFLTTKCNSLSSTTVSSSQEFCFETTAGGTGSYCTYDRLARGYCDVTTYSSSLPSYFQYYSSNSALGADVSLQDYCPVVLPYSNRICIDPSLQPTAGSSSDLYGETYSVNSRCFDSTLIKSGYSSTSSGNTVRCFAVSCVSGVLVLTISGTTVKCPTDGTAGSADLSGLSGFKGSVTCPAASFYGCTSSSSGSLGTTTAAGTVTASAGATSVPTTPAPPTPAPTPAPPTPLSNCNSTQPANDVFAPNTCTGYTTCDATYCTCVGGSGSTAAACTGTTTKGCSDVVPCLTQYYACLSALENARSNSSDPCNAFAVALHSATLLSAASSYSGSALQQSCQYNLCRITNTSSRIRSCSFGSASGFVCVDPLATTVAPATTPSPTTPTPTPSVTYQITATITLSGSAWATLVNDPTQYTSLLRAITFDLAALLSVSYTFVTVFKASVGSLVITFGVQSGSGKSTSSLVTSVNSAQSSTTWLSNTASVYSTVSSETLTVTSATVTATAAPTTTSPGASSAAIVSTAVAVIAAAIVAYAL